MIAALVVSTAMLLASSFANAQEPPRPPGSEPAVRPEPESLDGADSSELSWVVVEQMRAAQDPDGRIFLWPTAFRLEHAEDRVEVSPLGLSYTHGVRDVANLSIGMSFIGAFAATAKVGFDTERLSLAAHGGVGVVARGETTTGLGLGGAIATVGSRKLFANFAYSGLVATSVRDTTVYHLVSVGISARVLPRLRLVGHGALMATPGYEASDPTDVVLWWLAGVQAWGRYASVTVGLGQFGDLFRQTEADPECVDCGPAVIPAGIVQVAHVW